MSADLKKLNTDDNLKKIIDAIEKDEHYNTVISGLPNKPRVSYSIYKQ